MLVLLYVWHFLRRVKWISLPACLVDTASSQSTLLYLHSIDRNLSCHSKWRCSIWVSVHCLFHVWLHEVLHKVYKAISFYLCIVLQVYWLYTCFICHIVTTVILSSSCASSEYPWITSRRLLWVSNLSWTVSNSHLHLSKFWKLHGGGNPRFEPAPAENFPCVVCVHFYIVYCILYVL